MNAVEEKGVVAIPANGAIPSREQILKLQAAMIPIQCEQPEPIHRFAPGMYMRELTVPAGMLIVGKTHRHDHFLLVMSGRAEVISEFGREIVEAGHISLSKAGVKRVVLALEDTRFICMHHNPSDTEDLEVIEGEHIDASADGLSTDALADLKGELKWLGDM